MNVPDRPVKWLAYVIDDGRVIEVEAQTWFVARALAMAALGCNQSEVTCVQCEPK